MNDYKMNGIGTIPKGTYKEVKISGLGTIEGDIICDSLIVEGSLKSKGKIEAKTISVAGNATFLFDVSAKDISVSGRGVFTNIKSETLDSTGTCTVYDTTNTTNIKIEGNYTCQNVKATEIRIESRSFFIKNLHASKINIKINGLKLAFLDKLSNYTIENITCQDIEADLLKCKNLITTNAILHKSCKVEVLKYKGDIKIHKDAKVDSIIEI